MALKYRFLFVANNMFPAVDARALDHFHSADYRRPSAKLPGRLSPGAMLVGSVRLAFIFGNGGGRDPDLYLDDMGCAGWAGRFFSHLETLGRRGQWSTTHFHCRPGFFMGVSACRLRVSAPSLLR